MLTFLKKIVKDNNYKRSNSILAIDFIPSKKSKETALKILNSKTSTLRQKLADDLLISLSNDAKISQVKLKISDTRQWHKKRGGRTVFKQYGYYKPKTKYIYVQNRTAVRGQYISSKTFLNTVLHEWTHHYDFEKLKLFSIHTSGFFTRLKSLKEKLCL